MDKVLDKVPNDIIGEIIKLKPRPEVLFFAQIMEYKLRKNAKKEGSWPSYAFDYNGERDWKNLSDLRLFEHLQAEVSELEDELVNRYPILTNLLFECADVGCLSMMLATNHLRESVLLNEYGLIMTELEHRCKGE